MSKQQAPVVTQIIAQVVQGVQGSGQAAGVCEGCGLTFAQFRQAGMLGCAKCYGAFEGQLGPLLSRAHEGGTHHVGKVPRSAAGAVSAAARSEPGAAAQADSAAQRKARAAQLRKQLAEAVASEHYERAAALRDELQRLEESGPAIGAGQPSLARPRRARGGGKPASGEGA